MTVRFLQCKNSSRISNMKNRNKMEVASRNREFEFNQTSLIPMWVILFILGRTLIFFAIFSYKVVHGISSWRTYS